MSVRKTHGEFVDEVKARFKGKLTVKGVYINAKSPVLLHCNVCKHEWSIAPDNVLHNRNYCPKCMGFTAITDEDFQERVAKAHHGIISAGAYAGYKTKVDCTCNLCRHSWKFTPKAIVTAKSECSECAKAKRLANNSKCHGLSGHRFFETYYRNKGDIYLPADVFLQMCEESYPTDGKIKGGDGVYQIVKPVVDLPIKWWLKYRKDGALNKK